MITVVRTVKDWLFPELEESPEINDVSRRYFILGMGAAAVAPYIPGNRILATITAGDVKTITLASHEHIVALQLEKIRGKIPLLYERDDLFFKRIVSREPERISSRSMRIPLKEYEGSNR